MLAHSSRSSPDGGEAQAAGLEDGVILQTQSGSKKQWIERCNTTQFPFSISIPPDPCQGDPTVGKSSHFSEHNKDSPLRHTQEAHTAGESRFHQANSYHQSSQELKQEMRARPGYTCL